MEFTIEFRRRILGNSYLKLQCVYGWISLHEYESSREWTRICGMLITYGSSITFAPLYPRISERMYGIILILYFRLYIRLQHAILKNIVCIMDIAHAHRLNLLCMKCRYHVNFKISRERISNIRCRFDSIRFDLISKIENLYTHPR